MFISNSNLIWAFMKPMKFLAFFINIFPYRGELTNHNLSQCKEAGPSREHKMPHFSFENAKWKAKQIACFQSRRQMKVYKLNDDSGWDKAKFIFTETSTYYKECRNNKRIKFYTLEKKSHLWSNVSITHNYKVMSLEIRKSSLGWRRTRFFKEHCFPINVIKM